MFASTASTIDAALLVNLISILGFVGGIYSIWSGILQKRGKAADGIAREEFDNHREELLEEMRGLRSEIAHLREQNATLAESMRHLARTVDHLLDRRS